MIAERLLNALVLRLNAALPDGFIAQAERGWLLLGDEIRAYYGGTVVTSLLHQDGERTRLLAAAARSVLSDAQDWVAVNLTTPWPASAHDMPLPHVAVVGDVLELWYGDREAPTLRLESIDLSEIFGGASR